MRLKEFIRENRDEIDAAIVRAYGDNCQPGNDEGLYMWANMAGVPLEAVANG